MTTYFQRLRADTPTRVWVNNPTPDEVKLALEQGAVGCTTNPGYAGGLLRRAPDLVRDVVADAVAHHTDDEAAAQEVQLGLVRRIVEAFAPLHEASDGTLGFVSCQGSPETDDDAAQILAEGRVARRLGPNATPKIPATEPGLRAFETLVAEGSATIVTEVFSLAQLVEANERYIAVTRRTRKSPPFFMSPITGIFGDHLKLDAARRDLAAPPLLLELAGVILTRACYELCREREYPVRLLAGGARSPFDLTGLAGANLDVTINWSTFAEILAMDQEPEDSYRTPVDRSVVPALRKGFRDFDRAIRIDGLEVGEFASFGPVRFFREIFVSGWRSLIAAVQEARELSAVQPATRHE